MTTYKENLEEAVRKYQPEVESLFGVSLGEITLIPFKKPSGKPRNKVLNFILRNILLDDMEETTPKHMYAHINSSSPRIIKYNPLSDLDSLPRFSVDYTAVHEMSHLADFKISRTGPLRAPSVSELIANYAAHKILGLFENPEIPAGVYEAETNDALFLKSRLDKFGVSFRDYVENFNRLENIWNDFEMIKE